MGSPYGIEFCNVILGMSKMSRCREIRIVTALNANVPAAGLSVFCRIEWINVIQETSSGHNRDVSRIPEL